MPLQVKAVLWVDDEAELLEPHRIFLRDKGFEVETATNADDAFELVRRRAFDLVLLDEQMPGRRGLEALKELREIEPNLQVVMVTKSEEDGTLTEALGKNIAGYLVKPVTPRQVYAMVSGLLEGPRIRQQVVARSFVDRFRAMQGESLRDLDWRGWIDRYLEMVQWDLDLTAANEMGLHESLRGLFPDLRRDFALFMARAYPDWLANLEGDRPPLSIDIVSEFLMPVVQQDKAAAFIVIDCLRLDQWKSLEPVIAPLFDIETTHYFGVLPTATPYARNALFSGLFPNEIAARFPDWWGEREDETLNAHEKDLLEAHLVEMGRKVPVKYDKISSSYEADELERRLANAIAPGGHQRVRVQLRGPADARPLRVRDPLRGRARRDRTAPAHAAVVQALGAVQRAAGGGATEGEGAGDERSRLHPLPHAGHGVREARRHAESALQVRRGSARRESGARAAVQERGCAQAAAPRTGREHAAWLRAIASSCIPRSCASTRAAIAAPFCTAA